GKEAKGVLISGVDGGRKGKTEFTGTDLKITTKGGSSAGVKVENAGSANLLDSSITTEKAKSYALHEKNGGTIEAYNLNAETHGSGKFSHSVYAESGSTIILRDSRIENTASGSTKNTASSQSFALLAQDEETK